MSKRSIRHASTRTSRKSSTPSGSRRQFMSGVDAVALFELLENHFTDCDTSPYRRLYMKTRAAYLRKEAQGAQQMARLLNEVDEATFVEIATRAAGFVVGFNCCRQLLLGEVDLEQLGKE